MQGSGAVAKCCQNWRSQEGGSGGDFEGIRDSKFRCERFEFIAVKVINIAFGD